MAEESSPKEYLFEVLTPLGFYVRITPSYWELIVTIKHPVMAGREKDIIATLQNPSEIRRSRTDQSIFLFYQPERFRRWVCAVVKRLNGEGFLITTYPIGNIKEGESVWPK